MGRYLRLTDLFEIKCKKCNSSDIDLTGDYCEECGNTITANCNTCGNKYNYHDFKYIEE